MVSAQAAEQQPLFAGHGLIAVQLHRAYHPFSQRDAPMRVRPVLVVLAVLSCAVAQAASTAFPPDCKTLRPASTASSRTNSSIA